MDSVVEVKEVADKNGKEKQWQEIFREFALKTTAHGLSKICYSPSFFGRLLWSILCLAGVMAFLIQGSLVICEFFEYNVKMKNNVVSVLSLPFPSVTVCNTNKLRSTAIANSEHWRAKVVDEEYVLPYYAPCLHRDFACSNGNLCIKSYLVCDGIDHCRDMSDEENCAYGLCGDSQFRCESGSPWGYCIDIQNRCDRKVECYEAEDENNCECNEDEYKCLDGQGSCMSTDMLCDGIDDCTDGSDEYPSSCAIYLFKKNSNHHMPFTGTHEHMNVTLKQCAAMCLEHDGFDCLSFDYNDKYMYCKLNPGRIDEFTGAVYDDDTFDYYGKRIIDHSTLSHSMSIKFQRYRNTIVNNETELLYSSTITTEQCANNCLNELQFVCLAFVYQPLANECWLLDVNSLTSGVFLENDKHYDYYERRGLECYAEPDAKDYRGYVSVTVNGNTCQRWSQSSPHKHYLYDPDGGTGDHNYCRNPDAGDRTWCYTMNHDIRWEYCDIGQMRVNCLSSTPSYAYTQANETTECFTKPLGEDYRGRKSITSSGRTCQKWSEQFPHAHDRIHNNYPNGGLGDHNFCRNPDVDGSGPWCYTTDGDVRYEYCDVGEPSNHSCIGTTSECYTKPLGQDYRGIVSETSSGRTCQKWSEQFPHAHDRTSNNFPSGGIGDHNFCRNPDDDSGGLWCYTIDEDIRFEYCDVGEPSRYSCIGAECSYEPHATDYRGFLSTTVGGLTCQKWTDQQPHSHFYDPAIRTYSGIGDHNYCRNSVADAVSTWCFTTDPNVRWDTCKLIVRSQCSIDIPHLGFVYDRTHYEYTHYDHVIDCEDVNDCAKICVDHPDFICTSFDYSSSKEKCYLWNGTQATGSQGVQEMVDHFKRIITDGELTLLHFWENPNLHMPDDHKKKIHNFSAMQCAEACLEELSFRCRSFDYHPSSATCYLNDRGISRTSQSQPIEDISYVHYDMKDFIPSKKRLRLQKPNVMFAFNEYPWKHLSAFDDKLFYRTNVEECATLCILEEQFDCMSFVYKPVKRECMLSARKQTTGDVGQNTKNGDMYYYERRDIIPFESQCPDDYRRCGSGECVYQYAICDTIPNCVDHSDEQNCSSRVIDHMGNTRWTNIFESIPQSMNIISDFMESYHQHNDFSRVKGENPPDWHGFKSLSTSPDYSDLASVLKTSREDIATYGHQVEDVVIQCSYDGESCGPSDFYTFQDEKYGNCFKFNHGKYNTEVRSTSKQGANYGLKLTLFLEQNEYISMYGRDAGVRVVIEPSDRVALPQDEGTTIKPGTVTSIGLRETRIEKKSKPYGNCSEVREFDSMFGTHYKYSSLACQYTCVQREMLKYCDCVDSYDTGEARCQLLNQTQDYCRQFIRYLFQGGHLGCDCPFSCSDKWYTRTLSQSLWPANVHLKHLLKTIHSINPKTNDINDAAKVSANLARLEVYFEELVYSVSTELPAYGVKDLLSDIGGTLGLYIGISIITVVEFMELVTMITKYVFRRCRQRHASRVFHTPVMPITTRGPSKER
ncbi:uncharacterized protein LOC144356731 [Saccoglossus kowalevskii]